MWTTFKDCLDSILSNLDDFAVIIFILIVGNKIADLLYRFIANFLERSLFAAQTIKLLLQIFIGVISFIHLVGDDIIKNASAGIAIGIGYAFQPYIISMFNEIIKEIEKIELRKKIDSLEHKVSSNLDENLYTELLSLRNQLKGG